MDVLAIYGSPRKGGNTDLMLDAFLEGAEQHGADCRRIYVRRLRMQGCVGCGGCDETGTCVVKDDMQEVYPLLQTAPRIVVASPIYFYNITGQLKLLIDRSQASFMGRELARRSGERRADPGRKGFLLSAAATRGKRLFDCAILTMRYFFDAAGVAYAGELCFRELDDKGAVRDDPKRLEECRRKGYEFAAEDP